MNGDEGVSGGDPSISVTDFLSETKTNFHHDRVKLHKVQSGAKNI